ncbi:helix-turn-helix transcriptional regulator [Streptococcus agalactiae]
MTKETQNRIRELRKKSGLSQEKLAEQLGVYRNTISNWERGYSHINLANAEKLAQFFQVSIDYILGRSG